MSTSDHTDRLGLDRFDAVEAPDQWAEILKRAESGDPAGSNVIAMRRNRAWYLAAAASIVALVGGLVVVTQLRNDDVAAPIDQPAADAAKCSGAADLDAIIEVLRSGLPTYDYQPAADVKALTAQNDVVVRAELTRAARDPGTAPADLGDLGLTTVTLASVSVLAGGPSTVVDGFETASQWAVRSEADPLAEPVTFEQLEVIAFLSSHDDLPSGWTPDIEGWFVACEGGPAKGVIETPTFLDLSSLDALEAQIRGVAPEETVTTEPAPVDSLPTTTPPTSEPDDTVPEAAVTDDRWSPTCADLTGSGNRPAADTGLDEFGPLGAVPGLDIVLPLYRSPELTEATTPYVAIDRVDGGVVVLARPFDGQESNAYVLSVVDDDGAIRWRRCLDGAYAGRLLASPGAADVTVGEYPPANGSDAATWHTFDLTTGLDRESLAVPFGFDAFVVDGPYAVFGPNEDRITDDDDRLAVLDLRSGELDEIPFPPNLGIPAFRHEFQLVDDDAEVFRVLQRVDGSQTPVRGVWADGAWRTDDATILDAAGITAVNTFEDGGWEGRDGLGGMVWSRPDLLDIRMEGFHSGESGPTTVVNACREQTDSGCVDGSLVGIDTATGETLWERPGLRGASAIGDGFAIITNDTSDGWEMIDTRTGDLVDESQQWASMETFAQECCGAGDFIWVGRDGGVLFAVNEDRVRVWYPRGRSGTTISTSLMD